VLRVEQIHRRYHDLMLIYALTSEPQKEILDSPLSLDTLDRLLQARIEEAIEHVESAEFEGDDDQRVTERLILDQLEKTVEDFTEKEAAP
jgi:hypothetical protein